MILPIAMLYLPQRPQRDSDLPVSRGLQLFGMIVFSAAAWTIVLAACFVFWAGIYPVLF